MRARALHGFALVAAAIALAGACKSKGNGVGTAPPEVSCPSTASEGTPCGALVLCGACGGSCAAAQVCDDDSGAAAKDPPFSMFCPGGTGATWTCITAGDGGADADVGGESDVDGDVASDGEVEGDVDAEGDADADAGVDADAIEEAEADALPDTAPDVDLDADADADVDGD